MHHIRFSFGLALTIMVLGIVGCDYHKEEDLFPVDHCDTISVRYSTTVLPIVETNCAVSGCHVPGGSGIGDFTTYAGLNGQVTNGRLLPSIEQASDASAMPPYGKLSDCDIERITAWVEQGAPQN